MNLLICIGVGAIVGCTYAGVTSYNDGARGWELVNWTALGTVIGGTVGGIVGYYTGPVIASLFSSGGGFAFAGGLGSAGVAISSTMAGSLVTVGAIGLTSVGALAANGVMMFAKTSRQSKKVTSTDKPSWVKVWLIQQKKHNKMLKIFLIGNTALVIGQKVLQQNIIKLLNG